MPHTPHLMITGGGFAGLWVTRALTKAPLPISPINHRNARDEYRTE